MKKIISFEKNLDFNSMIGEVSAISLDHTLKFTSDNSIEGEFIISGKYKLTEASILEEDFNYNLPVDILLNEKLELETAKIDIDDFYYEIENDSAIVCHIDVKVEGVEKIEEVKEDEKIVEEATIISEPQKEIPVINTDDSPRECDGEKEEQETCEAKIDTKRDDNMEEIQTEVETEEQEEMKNNQQTEEVGSLFSSFKESDETFSSYSVYIIRENETVQSLIEKYKTTKEELENYNDLSNITIGSKIIIPTANE